MPLHTHCSHHKQSLQTKSNNWDHMEVLFQRKPHVCNFSARNSGARNGCTNFMGAWHLWFFSFFFWKAFSSKKGLFSQYHPPFGLLGFSIHPTPLARPLYRETKRLFDENALAQIFGAPGIFGAFCWKNPHAHRIPLFQGGVGASWKGGWKCQFHFMGIGIFQILRQPNMKLCVMQDSQRLPIFVPNFSFALITQWQVRFSELACQIRSG